MLQIEACNMSIVGDKEDCPTSLETSRVLRSCQGTIRLTCDLWIEY